MKQALSLTEVLISVMLITLVIATVLQIQQNNIFYLDKFKTSALNNGYIALIATSNVSDNRNTNIILSDKIDLGDDDIRREFKKIKIKVKDKKLDNMPLPPNDYIKTANVVESSFSIGDSTKKVFYSFKLNY